MPEGAECRIIGERLSLLVGQRKLLSISPRSGRYSKKDIPGILDFNPARVVGVGVRGKLIFWILKNEQFILSTLGMTGDWGSDPDGGHVRVCFEFDKGAPVYFSDMRNFGTLKIVYSKRAFLDKLNSIGPDLLSEEVDLQSFTAALDSKPHWSIAKALMDQSVVAGVGNYVKAESLYRAALSPHRLVGSLSGEEMSRIYNATRNVLKLAYETKKCFIERTSEEKNRTLELLVYGKKCDPAGYTILREKTSDGRITHWVPEVQK